MNITYILLIADINQETNFNKWLTMVTYILVTVNPWSNTGYITEGVESITQGLKIQGEYLTLKVMYPVYPVLLKRQGSTYTIEPR